MPQLLEIAESMNLENLARSRKQDVIFSILKAHAKSGEDIYGDGVLEILSDGFGFLRSADSSYLAGPDDIYVSPSQIRRFNLRKGDSIAGKIRPPKDSERYFALLKVDEINFDKLTNEIKDLDVIYPSIGENLSFLKSIKKKKNLNYNFIVREGDEFCWQFSNKGYFNFKSNIPKIIQKIT